VPARDNAIPASAAVLGHSESSYQKGVTKAYGGDIRQSVYTMRVEENFEHLFEAVTMSNYYVKRRKLTPSAITAKCEKEGFDSSEIKHRAEELQTGRQTAKDALAGMSHVLDRDLCSTAAPICSLF
jgi:hypothetical protein